MTTTYEEHYENGIFRRGYKEDLDPETGLPRTPEGHYWKVTKEKCSMHYPYFVKLMKGRKVVSRQPFQNGTKEDLIEKARYVLYKVEEKSRALKPLEFALGNYPPNRLEDK